MRMRTTTTRTGRTTSNGGKRTDEMIKEKCRNRTQIFNMKMFVLKYEITNDNNNNLKKIRTTSTTSLAGESSTYYYNFIF